MQTFIRMTKKYVDRYYTRFKFQNGYGASVIKHEHSYGGKNGLYELGVLIFKDKSRNINDVGLLCYSTPITCDVIGWLTRNEVKDLLEKIQLLPPVI